MDFKKNTKPKNPEKKFFLKDALKSVYAPFDSREIVFSGFKSGIFAITII